METQLVTGPDGRKKRVPVTEEPAQESSANTGVDASPGAPSPAPGVQNREVDHVIELVLKTLRSWEGEPGVREAVVACERAFLGLGETLLPLVMRDLPKILVALASR